MTPKQAKIANSLSGKARRQYLEAATRLDDAGLNRLLLAIMNHPSKGKP